VRALGIPDNWASLGGPSDGQVVDRENLTLVFCALAACSTIFINHARSPNRTCCIVGRFLQRWADVAEGVSCCRGGQLLQRGAVVEAQRAGELYTETEIRVYLL